MVKAKEFYLLISIRFTWFGFRKIPVLSTYLLKWTKKINLKLKNNETQKSKTQ